MFTNTGKNIIRDWLGSKFPNPPYFMALGSVGTTPTVSDTVLGSEIIERNFDSINTNNDRLVEFEMILPSTSPTTQPVNLREVGLFNGSPVGSMFSHNIFTTISKTTDVELQSIVAVRIE